MATTTNYAAIDWAPGARPPPRKDLVVALPVTDLAGDVSFQAAVAAQRSARAVARGALLAGGAQGEGAHAGRGHGRQHRHHPRGLSRGQGAVAQARATRVRGQVLRSYTLLAAETLIIVNHMVRLAGLRFSPGPGGPADRQLRSAREKLSPLLAYRRITRSRRAAVKTSLIELVWRRRFVQKCVLESVNMAKFSSAPAGPLAAGLESRE